MPLKILGQDASKYKTTIEILNRGEPIVGWINVASSVNTQVIYSPSLGAYLKVFLARSKLEGLKTAFRGSRCQRARQNGAFLVNAGFNTPPCNCWGKLENGQEYMITMASAGTGITEYIYDQLHHNRSPEGLKHRRNFLLELGIIIGQLHLAGIVHGDLRTSNILTKFNGANHDFYFIDNERNSHHRAIPLKLIRKNLIQLNMLLPTKVSRSDRWRFFAAYNSAYSRFTTTEITHLANEVYSAAMIRLNKKGQL